jgi:hypothetical protein
LNLSVRLFVLLAGFFLALPDFALLHPAYTYSPFNLKKRPGHRVTRRCLAPAVVVDDSPCSVHASVLAPAAAQGVHALLMEGSIVFSRVRHRGGAGLPRTK